MTTNTTSGVVLEQVSSTLLYEPTPPSLGEHLVFLRWATTNPPESIPLEQTWADSGLPNAAGYFLFLNELPQDAAAFEQEIRKELAGPANSAPTTSAFAWATSSAPPSIQTLLKTKLNNSQPCVDGDTELSLPPGLERIGFANNAPVLSIRTDGFITGFVIMHPALTSTQSDPVGLILPMTGSFVGCIQFEGLTSRFAQQPVGSNSAYKNLVNVSIDPHNPLDTQRNYMCFTGAEYILTQLGDLYFITRVS